MFLFRLILAGRTLLRARVAACALLALLVALSASLVFPATGVKYIPGLLAGESAYYSIIGNYGYIPTEHVTQMKVLSVTGTTNVTASFVNFFPDGHISPDFWIDVFTGQRYNVTSVFYFAVASGLKPGDPIYNSWSNVTISAAQAFQCGGVSRSSVGTHYSSQYGQLVFAIWDQSTGVLCSYRSSDVAGRNLELDMINSTIWNPPALAVDPFTIGAEISVLFGLPLVAIIMFVYFRQRRATRFERLPGNR
jgi:hypothetical protein